MKDSHQPRNRFATIAVLVLAAVPLVAWMSVFVTDYLWFVDLGQRGVFVATLVSRLLTGLAFGVVAFALLYANMRVARSMAPRALLTSVGEMPAQVEDFVLTLRAKMGPVIDRIIFWGSATIGVLVGLSMSQHWEVFRLAFASVRFGARDPEFGRDIGFYVFSLPALRVLADWIPSILIGTIVLTVAVHVVDGAVQPWARLKGFAPHVKAHVSVLVGLVVASKAFDYWLDIYELNFSPRGQVTGASYTDVHAQLPALRILIVIAVVSAIALVVNIRFRGWRLPAVSLAVWIGASAVLGGVYPALVQQFRVAPNEIAKETPYIRRNIEATRRAFGIDEVEKRPFPAAETLTPADVTANQDTLENVRLWDPGIVTQSYRQLQIIRQYYDFRDVDIDRYDIDGRTRQVLVSVREMDVQQLEAQAQTWVNQHLLYTHGYGLVMSPVNETDARGFPRFIIADIPPETTTDLKVEQPAVYFGEATDDYVIVNTGIAEFDYPLGDQNAETIYKGSAGINAGSLLRRLAFAVRFGSSQILFSQYINSDSRVLFARDITTRVNRLAPWLLLDEDPYPVLSDGRIVWVMDGYTASDRYPYSEPLAGGMSYLRNSVKVVVDAYEGTVTLYAFDETDPILKAWRTVFPDLVTDGTEIPDDIRAHFRYPEDLFSVQAEVYQRYHMTDPRVFYNKEDLWELPGQRQGTPMDPYYVLMRLPGEPAEDFQMIMPFVPRNRDNMIGWMAAKSDPADFGKRIVYEFPKQRVILGPDQVRARINQDETISPQLTLWSQRGSQVISGNMLVIPLEDSIVYIQPLYLQAEQTAIPELTRVIVVYADKVEMAPDLQSALLSVFGAETPDETPGGGAPADAATASDLYERAMEAQRQGDWAEYGRLVEELGGVLRELAGESAIQTATPAP